MSQFPSAPPPGAYVPPTATEGTHTPQAPAPNPQQQYYQQQSQGQAPSYGAPQNHKKPGLGGMFDQAVTQGKPMFNKLSKQISSKLSGKQSAPTPQHLSSYQNYQNHQYGQQPPPQAQQPSPQPQQQQWQQPPPQGQQNAHPPSQQPSPFPQSNYATPASGHSGQSNYFPQQQAPQSPSPQVATQQQPNAPGYNPNQFPQSPSVGTQQQGQSGQGQFEQGQFNPGQIHGQPHQGQQIGQFGQAPPQGQQYGQVNQSQQPGQTNPGPHQGQIQQPGTQQSLISEQQTTGIIGSSQSPHQSISTPNFPPQQNQQHQQQQQQQQWAPIPSPNPSNVNPPNPASPSPALQNVQPFTHTPPPQPYGVAPNLPVHPNQPQPQQQPPQQLQQQSQPQIQQQYQPQPQQWPPVSPSSPQGPPLAQTPHAVSPPPPQTSMNQPPAPSSVPPQSTQQQPPPSVPNQKPSAPSAPTEFIAELPGDLADSNAQRSSSSTPPNASPYQAYQPPAANRRPSPGFAIPRRAVSMIGMPLADPWAIADSTTELPTREFYMIADVLFDTLDRRFEPQNTGMLEATKILESWKLQELPQEVAEVFAHDTFSAFARLWCLEGIPHMMVPCQSSLTPSWAFKPQTDSHDLKVPTETVPENSTYPAYMPAINRAGWYKYLFLELSSEPESLDKAMHAICGGEYKPDTLNQPDIQKRDRTELPALSARATAIRTSAIPRVCQETAAAMQTAQHEGAAQNVGAGAGAGMTEQELALKMQALKMQQQISNMANQNMIAGGQSFSMAAGNTYVPRY